MDDILGDRSRANLSGITCAIPYWQLEVYDDGRIGHCCPTWLSTPIGNIKETSLYQAIYSQNSEKIRASIESGEFSYCSKTLCPFLSKYVVSKEISFPILSKNSAAEGGYNKVLGRNEVHLMLNYDKSCNLKCPSCRSDSIMTTEKNISADQMLVHDAIKKNIKELLEMGNTVHLGITSTGDAFASPLFARLLRELEFNDRLFLAIYTNGVLMEEHRFTEPMYKMIKSFGISVDAASEEVYRSVRRGGNFKKLMENIRWLDKAIQLKKFPNFAHLTINFVVQKENFREMKEFAQFFTEYSSVNSIWFNLIADWGHLGRVKFEDLAVWRVDHPEHNDFLKVINDDYFFHNPRINMGSLSHYRNEGFLLSN